MVYSTGLTPPQSVTRIEYSPVSETGQEFVPVPKPSVVQSPSLYPLPGNAMWVLTPPQAPRSFTSMPTDRVWPTTSWIEKYSVVWLSWSTMDVTLAPDPTRVPGSSVATCPGILVGPVIGLGSELGSGAAVGLDRAADGGSVAATSDGS